MISDSRVVGVGVGVDLGFEKFSGNWVVAMAARV